MFGQGLRRDRDELALDDQKHQVDDAMPWERVRRQFESRLDKGQRDGFPGRSIKRDARQYERRTQSDAELGHRG
jgi:hypothetical protein